jgi:hypothetical protein
MKAAGNEARSTTGQAELGKNISVPKYNLGTRGNKRDRRAGVPARQEHRLGSLCHQKRRRPQAALREVHKRSDQLRRKSPLTPL